ncbi:MAG TPA: hypothetical protein VMF32_10460 [Xanthobacteraceae bacterium]|jgi:hypothetical protein|nr:hypothetical protein [Xanthobacteraceae bacterium]
MKTIPTSLTIAFWVTGSSWVLALFVYLLGGPPELILPIIVLGTFTGVIEWTLRQKLR